MSRFVDFFETQLTAQCKELIERHERYVNWLNGEKHRRMKFFVNPSPFNLETPKSWAQDGKYNPYYVRRHARAIARSVVKKLLDGTYQPNAPYSRQVPKAGGGERTIFEYQIPDSTVSDVYYRKLLTKNRHRFSSYAYAYRDDRNVHFAIQELSVGLQDHQRMFVAEYDFSKFFDSIRHDYLNRLLSSNGLFVTDHERAVKEEVGSRRGGGHYASKVK